MVGIFNTYHTADHMNPVVGGKQQMLSCLDPLPVQILQGEMPYAAPNSLQSLYLLTPSSFSRSSSV